MNAQAPLVSQASSSSSVASGKSKVASGPPAASNLQPSPGNLPPLSSPPVDVKGLWKRYGKQKSGSAVENELVQVYLPLVKTVVGRLAMTLPPHVDMEDLYSAGLVGLLSAVRQFDPKMGTIFESYARLRIRGAVLDELRRMDWVPRSVHVKARQIEATMREIESRKRRAPTDEEMAKALKISVREYQQWLDEIRPATFVSLDAAPHFETDDGTGQNETIADARQELPLDGVSRRELIRLIASRLEELPDMQKKVLALYYFEDLRLREIAEVFGLTESRICQIHAKAIISIRAAINKMESAAAA